MFDSKRIRPQIQKDPYRSISHNLCKDLSECLTAFLLAIFTKYTGKYLIYVHINKWEGKYVSQAGFSLFSEADLNSDDEMMTSLEY